MNRHVLLYCEPKGDIFSGLISSFSFSHSKWQSSFVYDTFWRRKRSRVRFPTSCCCSVSPSGPNQAINWGPMYIVLSLDHVKYPLCVTKSEMSGSFISPWWLCQYSWEGGLLNRSGSMRGSHWVILNLKIQSIYQSIYLYLFFIYLFIYCYLRSASSIEHSTTPRVKLLFIYLFFYASI